ncbi:MAG: cytidylate kinase family protein [Dysgonamonadaceae bacterium]|jgi:cytidylate kinase|nr:cytidylate kinase family protein [Dysgonamonadaceae bacterium]
MAKIISITGDLGSGKSTVSNLLYKRLGYDYIYTGKIQRDIAGRYNMTTLELNKYSEIHPEIDEEIDATFKSLNEAAHLIVDSRLSWFFIPKSFKVYLKTNLIISANRILDDNLRETERYSSKEEAANMIIARKTSENKRYRELYGVDCSNLSNFDLIVDTSFITPERVAEIILTEYNLWLESGTCYKSFVSPTNLYPTQSIRDFGYEYFKNIQDNMKMNGYDMDFPIIAVHINSFDYILDGHKRTSSAIKNGIDLIPVTYKNGNSFFTKGLTYKENILNSIKPSLFYDWEDFNSFNYLIYPIK